VQASTAEVQGLTPPGRGARGKEGLPSWIRRHPLLLAGLFFGVGILAVIAVFCAWYESQVSLGPPKGQVIVNVRSGWSLSRVGVALSAAGVIHSSLAWHLYLLLHGSPVVSAGLYEMKKDEPFSMAMAQLRAGPSVYRFTVVPGMTVSDLVQLYGDLPGSHPDQLLADIKSGRWRSPYEPAGTSSLEGLLGAGNYLIGRGENPGVFLSQMIERFDATARSVGLNDAPALVGVSPYQAVIVASLVAKEALLPSDRGKVARVVYNRLAKGMRLQFDSTVVYALGGHVPGGVVTIKDTQVRSPYNTYLHKGLPPTPIATVDRADLQAALHPTPGPWLYFVAVSATGKEAFSTTYAGQLRNENLAEKNGVIHG
jgi:UPF0755 protein